MQSEEQRLIEGLFSRLQQAESSTAPRDAEAERVIQSYITKQPAAPYYMAQAMIIQEAALKRLNAQVQALQEQVAQLQTQAQNARPQSTGFLAGLFGGGSSNTQSSQSSSGSAPIPGTNGWGAAPQQQAAQPQQAAQQQYAPQQQQPAQAAPFGSGFLGGALKTAAGVAGGVVLADMLTGMFHQSRPEEIVNIIEEPQTNFDPNNDPLLSGDNSWDNPRYNNDSNFQDASYQNDNGGLFGSDNSFGSDNDFGSDSYGSDDDDDDSFF